MSRSEPAEVRSNDALASATPPTVEAGRYERACTETMTTEAVAGRLYRIENGDGSTYDVDVEGGGCTCADHQFRGDEYLCKHVVRAALIETYAETVSTELVACVVAFATANPCPHGYDGLCDGPTGPRLPCPGCMDSVRSSGVDEWVVYQRAVTEDR